MNIEILPPEGKFKHFRNPQHLQKNAVPKVPTEGQTQTLRRHSDPNTPLCIRSVDDDGRNEEAPDNATTDDEDDHTDRETNWKRCTAALAARQAQLEPSNINQAKRVPETRKTS